MQKKDNQDCHRIGTRNITLKLGVFGNDYGTRCLCVVWTSTNNDFRLNCMLNTNYSYIRFIQLSTNWSKAIVALSAINLYTSYISQFYFVIYYIYISNIYWIIISDSRGPLPLIGIQYSYDLFFLVLIMMILAYDFILKGIYGKCTWKFTYQNIIVMYMISKALQSVFRKSVQTDPLRLTKSARCRFPHSIFYCHIYVYC